MRVVLLCVLSACQPSASTVVEIPPEPLPSGTQTPGPQPVISTRARTLDDAQCAARPSVILSGCELVAKLQVSEMVTSSPTCYVDTVVQAGNLGQLFHCPDGDVAVFQGRRTPAEFVGVASGAQVDLCTGSTFPFTDGCTWQSTQRIRGSLSGRLFFHYRESVISGTECAPSACTATARVEVVP